MLFCIFVILLAGGIIWAIFDEYGDYTACAAAISATGFAGIVISLIIMGINYIGADGYVAAMHERHESLVYQYENDVYENDNDYGKRELMEDIQSWNEDLASMKELQDNFWVGVYTPNIYDQFEFIELDRD